MQVEEEISGWQTYFQFNGIHKFHVSTDDYTVQKFATDPVLRTGYGYVSNGQLMVRDVANGGEFFLDGGVFLPNPTPPVKPYTFHSGDWKFDFVSADGQFSACNELAGGCVYIEVEKSTFPFVYAESANAVLAITNWGDAVKFDGENWCRMEKANDVWSCPINQQPPLEEPRREQFYSSALFQGKTYLGHWPTGVLYYFDGNRLSPDRRMTPPPIWESRSQDLGYEAQSMSVYCGDFFVGYWPRGEIWRFDRQSSEWHFLERLFSHGSEDSFVPYLNRESDDFVGAFFGQRVTTLVPHDDSLFAFTANLNSWTTSIQNPVWLTEDEIQEYGAIWRIYRSGCETMY